MTKEQTVAYWMEKTKLEVKETERKLKAEEIFLREFKFFPTKLGFDNEGKAYAYSEVKIQDNNYTIENRQVSKVEFLVKEINNEEDKNVNEKDYTLIIEKEKNRFKWEKRIENHKVLITIWAY